MQSIYWGSQLSASIFRVMSFRSLPDSPRQWTKVGVGVATFVKDSKMRSFFIRIYSLSTNTKFFEEEMYQEFDYTAPSWHFHYFTGQSVITLKNTLHQNLQKLELHFVCGFACTSYLSYVDSAFVFLIAAKRYRLFLGRCIFYNSNLNCIGALSLFSDLFTLFSTVSRQWEVKLEWWFWSHWNIKGSEKSNRCYFKLPLNWSEKLVFEQIGCFWDEVFSRCVNLTSVDRDSSPSVLLRWYMCVLIVSICL